MEMTESDSKREVQRKKMKKKPTTDRKELTTISHILFEIVFMLHCMQFVSTPTLTRSRQNKYVLAKQPNRIWDGGEKEVRRLT